MSLFSGIYTQSHEDNRIFVSAKETNPDELNSHRLPVIVPRLIVVFQVYHRIRPDRLILRAGMESRIARREFLHPFESFASADAAKPAVEAMLSSIELPFRLDGGDRNRESQLRWKEGSGDGDVDITDVASVPMDSIGSAVARVSELGARIVASGAGRGEPLKMLVTIRKVMVVSAERYAAMFEDFDDEGENYDDVSDEIGMYLEVPEDLAGLRLSTTLVGRPPPRGAEGHAMAFYDDEEAEDLEDVLSQLAMYFDIPDSLLEGIGVIPVSTERPPSAAVAAEAFETVRYEGDGDEASKLTCPICIDDVAIGCHITRLPCSHRFHRDCIGKWLVKTRTCPLCRSEL